MAHITRTQPARPLSALDVIFTRRSVRAYEKKKIDQQTIRALLDAAVRAPTAMQAEPWLFLVIQDERTLTRYSNVARTMKLAEMESQLEPHWPDKARRDRCLAELRNPEFSIFYNAPVLIVICARSRGPFVEADCWLAAENLMLAACALGLGSCAVGAAVAAFKTPDAVEEFGLPRDSFAVAPIVIGVPSGAAGEPQARREPEIIWS
jgi:nitroreductase